MLDLDALADALGGRGASGRMIGDDARQQVTELVQARIAELMERDGITQEAALARLLEMNRQTS